MQWLTAILAFATTMLIFAVVVSAIVETIHRVLGSRSFGLMVMLEHYYDDVLAKYLEQRGAGKDAAASKDAAAGKAAAAGNPLAGTEPAGTGNKPPRISKDDFVKAMVTVRAPGVSKTMATRSKWNIFATLLSPISRFSRFLFSKLAGTSKVAADLDHSSWRLLTSLPVETFMERLGTLGFADDLGKAIKKEDTDRVLKDIAQKFELFGQESALYFETKARTISVAVALLTAWVFYVHPYDLIQTYLKDPVVAAQVAELSDSTLEKNEDQKKALEIVKEAQEKATGLPSSADLEELIAGIEQDIADGREQAKLLADAGAPVGWPKEGAGATKIRLWSCTWPKALATRWDAYKCEIDIFRPTEPKDIFWLLVGGLLIGLGAPFWARTITQLSRARNATQNVSKILQPDQSAPRTTQAVVVQDAKESVPLTTEAFKAAAAAVKKDNNDEDPDNAGQDPEKDTQN